MTGFIELQTVSGDIALIRLDQVVGIVGRDAEQKPERDPRHSDTPRWSINRGSYIEHTDLYETPKPEAPPSCKVRLMDGTEYKLKGTARDLQAQLMLASRPAWRVLLDWLKLKSARPWQW